MTPNFKEVFLPPTVHSHPNASLTASGGQMSRPTQHGRLGRGANRAGPTVGQGADPGTTRRHTLTVLGPLQCRPLKPRAILDSEPCTQHPAPESPRPASPPPRPAASTLGLPRLAASPFPPHRHPPLAVPCRPGRAKHTVHAMMAHCQGTDPGTT